MRISRLKKYKYKYDLHTHTSPVSTCADFSPMETVEKYAALGFSGFVLTNHFNLGTMGSHSEIKDFVSYYLNDYYEAKKAAQNMGLDVFLGMEIRFPENANDYLVYGICENDVYRASQYLESDYKTFYKEFKTPSNIIIQAHPFRNSVTLCDLKYVDGIEVFNMHPGHNARIALAAKLANDNPDLLVTGGTDFHHEGHEGLCAVCTKKEVSDSYDIAKIISSGDFIFDISGTKIIPKQI